MKQVSYDGWGRPRTAFGADPRSDGDRRAAVSACWDASKGPQGLRCARRPVAAIRTSRMSISPKASSTQRLLATIKSVPVERCAGTPESRALCMASRRSDTRATTPCRKLADAASAPLANAH